MTYASDYRSLDGDAERLRAANERVGLRIHLGLGRVPLALSALERAWAPVTGGDEQRDAGERGEKRRRVVAAVEQLQHRPVPPRRRGPAHGREQPDLRVPPP